MAGRHVGSLIVSVLVAVPFFVHAIISILEAILQAIRSAAVSHCSKTAALAGYKYAALRMESE
jgi:hypothetical protein